MKFTIEEMKKDLNFLEYYKENVIDDMEENIIKKYPEKQHNELLKLHLNESDFNCYLTILRKYFNEFYAHYHDSEWYEVYFNTANIENSRNVINTVMVYNHMLNLKHLIEYGQFY